MTSSHPATERGVEQRVYLHGVGREDYERLLAMRGESSGVRITFLGGAVELMSPSRSHERIETTLARLVEAYAEEQGLALTGTAPDDQGAARRARRGAGRALRARRPRARSSRPGDRGRLDVGRPRHARGVYRGLGAREVWFWQRGQLTAHELQGERDVERPRNLLLPGLDQARVATLAPRPDQTRAVRECRQELRRG